MAYVATRHFTLATFKHLGQEKCHSKTDRGLVGTVLHSLETVTHTIKTCPPLSPASAKLIVGYISHPHEADNAYAPQKSGECE